MTKPMLCKEWKEEKAKTYTPCFMQPKLDGIRCIASYTDGKLSLMSRNEKPLSLPHLTPDLEPFFKIMTNTQFLDGELYLHGKSFQEVASLVKRANHPLQDTISYHIYDRQFVPRLGNQSFAKRFYELSIGHFNLKHVTKVLTKYVSTEDAANRAHATFVLQGYEGSIYRTNRCEYQEGKRSPDLLKRKDWQEDDFVVVGVREGKGKNEGTAVLTCQVGNNASTTFDVTAQGTYQEKAALFRIKSKCIGMRLSIKYQNLTDGGIPRFPIALGFKEDR
jgi:DNA ligase-1